MASHDLHFQVNNNQNTYDQPMAALPDPQQQQQSQNTVQYLSNKLSQSSHPTVLVFHLFFKGMAFVVYFLGGIFVSSVVVRMVICILLLAADFWVVKNITGRLLVGLRWWNRVENDTTTWIFEAATDKPVNSLDRSVFWTVLYATPCVWGGFLIINVMALKFEWLLIHGMGLSLSGANVYGYYKCSSDQKTQLQNYMAQGAQQGAMAVMRSNMLSMVTGQQQTSPQGNAGSNFV